MANLCFPIHELGICISPPPPPPQMPSTPNALRLSKVVSEDALREGGAPPAPPLRIPDGLFAQASEAQHDMSNLLL